MLTSSLIGKMEVIRNQFNNIVMRDGETIDSILDLNKPTNNMSSDKTNVVLLTNARVIHLVQDGSKTSTNFAVLESIDGVEVASEGKSYTHYVWGALSIIAAFTIWRIWQDSIASLISSALVLLMGSYLVFDHMTNSRTKHLIFKTRSFQFQCNLQYKKSDTDVYQFIDRFFDLRDIRPQS